MRSRVAKKEAEPGATDNLGYAQRIREAFSFRSSEARCLSFIVRQDRRKAMILAFAGDNTVRVFDSLEQANIACETIDVLDRYWRMFDERGFALRPVIAPPRRSRFLGLMTTVGSETFTLEPTNERDDDLFRRLDSGDIRVAAGPTEINSIEKMRTSLPQLFSGKQKER